MKKLYTTLSIILSLCFIFAGCEILEYEEESISVSSDSTNHSETEQDSTELELPESTGDGIETSPSEGATETPTEPVTEPTTAPAETEPTTPAHKHAYANATCTTPRTCTCGATEGSAKGHKWSTATCSKPKTCSVCGVTEGAAKGHLWVDATYAAPKTCSNCGATEGSSLEKPGKENYHGHVYTGGQYSKKFHYEAECAGTNSHEITWEEVDDRNLGPCGTCVLK